MDLKIFSGILRVFEEFLEDSKGFKKIVRDFKGF